MFAKHGTFYVRNGWLRKGLMAIKKDPLIFSPSNMELAIDTLGIGKVMVTSLRYWLVTLGLTEESRQANAVVQNITEFGKIIIRNDEYFERKGTLWLLHYKLATNKEKATTWYWFFNIFPYKEFDKELFINELKMYCDKVLKKKVSESSLNKDFLCLKNTYLYSKNISNKFDLEETIDCPFRELKLLSEKEYSNKILRLNININELDASVVYYCILDRFNPDVGDQISFDKLVDEENSIGKIFNLTNSQLYKYFDEMEKRDYIRVYKRFGHNYIVVLRKDKKSILEEYYSNHYID